VIANRGGKTFYLHPQRRETAFSRKHLAGENKMDAIRKSWVESRQPVHFPIPYAKARTVVILLNCFRFMSGAQTYQPAPGSTNE
jgi:hypothetical protein